MGIDTAFAYMCGRKPYFLPFIKNVPVTFENM